MYDQHVHSSYSIDSNETMENYIKNTDAKIITFTEHYDLGDPFNDYNDVLFDIIGQRKEMDILQEKYGVKLLQGIEIGYSRKNKARIKEVLNNHQFDIVLLSVHHNDDYDYMMDIKEKTQHELVHEYFELVEEALRQGYGANTLCHLDFGLRMRNLSIEDIKGFEKQIRSILSKVITLDMSLEINSKGFSLYDQEDTYDYFLDIYKELGGKNIVVNSDAHSSDYYQYNFMNIYKFVKLKGFNILNYYDNGEVRQFEIKDL